MSTIVRAVRPGGFELSEGTGTAPVLVGHFAVFDQWTEINSQAEGRFMERVAPGAFAHTFRDHRDRIRVLYNHGKDPSIGEKPLGPISVLREDERGGYYEVELLDTSYNRDLVPGLRAGCYGSSFRFQVGRDDWDPHPRRSASNPDALPERTIRRAHLYEMGPCTFPAYLGATAGVRSMTDYFLS